MSEGRKVLEAARCKRDAREAAVDAQPPTDYDALNKMVKRQRGALTKAKNSGDPDKVVLACHKAVNEWSQPGAMWPDDWSSWQGALDDALGLHGSIDLRDLVGVVV